MKIAGYQTKISNHIKARGLAIVWQGHLAVINKKSLIFAASTLIIISGVFNITMPAAKAEEIGLLEQQKITSHMLINLFMEKLDQNELLVFKHALKRSDLQAHQVSYVHNIADNSLIVRLCFNLQKIILVPKFEEFYVDMITVETDKDGSIIQIKTHVSPLDKKGSKQQGGLR